MNDESPVPAIARALQEHALQGQVLIRRAVRVLGVERTWAFAHAAQALEAQGGLWLAHENRRRTLGGIFFVLVRQGVSTEEQQAIFRKRSSAGGTKRGPLPAPAVAPFDWAERGAVITQAETGKADTVKVTLMGRPAKVVEQPGFTLLRLVADGTLPALPKGIPIPPVVPPTTYIVYVGAKQWQGVKAALANTEDTLIIEGRQFYDAEYQAIAVFAMSTTTKLLQQAKKAAPKATRDAA